MALSYLAQDENSVFITGLSTDTKPPSPVTGWTFLETDTGKFFIVVGGVWTGVFNDAYALFGEGGVPSAWGAISGVLSAQTDLQNALNLKANLISPAFTTPNIGAATGASLITTGGQTSSGGGIGYSAGAGGTVTQLTSRATTVTLNKLCGNITMFSAAQAANAIITFTLTNSFIAATDYLLVQHISATNGGAWVFSTVCGAGSATISITNSTATSITSATPLRFFVLKAVVS